MIIINTNALISLSVSVVTNFAQLVGIGDYRVPADRTELSQCMIGDGVSPTAVYFEDQSGYRFWVRNGVVWRFSAPGSFENWNRNPARIGVSSEDAKLSTNQAVKIASETVTRLAKGWNPTVQRTPVVVTPQRVRGEQPPFYFVSWPTTNPFPLIRWSAFVEMDARNGKITFVELKDRGFNDYAKSIEISNRVCTVHVDLGTTPEVTLQQHLPQKLCIPTAIEVQQGIKSWLWLCAQLGISPGNQTNLASINWEQTFTYTDAVVSARSPIVQVVFTNSSGFSCLDGVAFSHVSSDSCFASPSGGRSQEQWNLFRGPINKSWKDLSSDLQKSLEEKLLIPAEVFSTFVPSPDREPPDVGTEGKIKRLVIEWRKWPPHKGSFIPVEDTNLGFSAEFDLENGRLVWISFWDRTFLNALVRAQHLEGQF